MGTITLFTAASIDGLIARPDGSVDWLEPFQRRHDGSLEDHGYREFVAPVGAILMGSHTYEKELSYGASVPHRDKLTYVFSRRSLPRPPNGEIVATDPVAFTRELRSRVHAPIWLAGGGRLNRTLLEADLVDELRIFVAPVMLGEGIRLVDGGLPRRQEAWKLMYVRRYETGIFESRYSLTR